MRSTLEGNVFTPNALEKPGRLQLFPTALAQWLRHRAAFSHPSPLASGENALVVDRGRLVPAFCEWDDLRQLGVMIRVN